MRCIAVDDEKWALDLLVDNIRHVPYLELAGRCKNAREASEILHREKIDLMFMDVQMPGLSGLQFIETLPEPPLVILVTAYEQYALEGFNLSVVDYLVKPVPLERFIKACNKAKQLFDMKQAKPAATATDHFFANVEYSLVKIVFDDITHIEGLKDYVSIFTPSERVITLQNMKKLEEALPTGRFARVHKSYIVAIDKIESIERSRIQIGDKIIPIGDTYRDSFYKLIEDKNI